MITITHTPGPWGAYRTRVYAGPFRRVPDGIAGFRSIICEVDDFDIGELEAEANARLLADAPYLLDLLEKARLVIEDFLPNVGHCALQDYGRLNDVLIDSAKVLRAHGRAGGAA